MVQVCFRYVSIVLCSIVLWGCGSSGPKPLKKAHSHNDYQHKRPLLDALDRGFCSVEADVYLVSGQLLVAHDLKDTTAERTLQSLYLEPLRARIAENGGSVYGNGAEFTLLIDVKSDAFDTYRILHSVLAGYEDMLVVVRDDVEKPGPVRVIISGNRSIGIMIQQNIRFAGFDGRLVDLEADYPAHLMPWISDHAGKVSAWRFDRPFPAKDRQKLKDITAQAHAKGRKVRLWATPDDPKVWNILQKCDVDIIGTDNLDALTKYLR